MQKEIPQRRWSFLKKRLLAIVLTLALLFTSVPVTAFAIGPEDALLNDLDWSFDVVADAVEDLNLGGTASATLTFSDIFNGAMSVIGPAATVLTFVNGSVTFLRLIGVMKDPTAEALTNILDKLDTMNQTMRDIDDKLDDLTHEMTQIHADIDFQNRASRADRLHDLWTDFSRNYMENALDKRMVEFQTMMTNGLRLWCRNSTTDARSHDEIDNNVIVLKYEYSEKTEKFEPVCVLDNAIPASCSDTEKYVSFSADLLPATFSWNVDTFVEDMTSYLSTQIADALSGGHYEYFESLNLPMLTPEGASLVTEEAIKTLAADAVSALTYRVGAAELRNNYSFASEVVYEFETYCKNLLAAENGMDAMYKTLYLSHAFEFEISKDLLDFSDRMIVKTGTYAAFAANVMGMSDLISNSKKEATMRLFADTTKELHSAKENALTHSPEYCYLTNTRVFFTDIEFETETSLSLVKDGWYWNYKGMSTKPITTTLGISSSSAPTLLDEYTMRLLCYTLQSAGHITDLYDYFYGPINFFGSPNYRYLVINYKKQSELSKTGSLLMDCHHISGDYFNGVHDVRFDSLPDEDASTKYIGANRKIDGLVFDLETGQFLPNMTLIAGAGYGETSMWWFEDENALFGGPKDREGYSGSMDYTGNFNRTYTLSTSEKYDTLVSLPLPASELSETPYYNPLKEFRVLSEELKPKAPPAEGEPSPIVLGGEEINEEENPDTGAPFVFFLFPERAR